MNTTEMQQRLEAIQEEAEKIKQALAKTVPTIQDAKPGDVLEDGCIVIQKFDGAALIAAPRSTGGYCVWGQFEPVFNNLAKQGFTLSQWFIPSVEQLKIAYKVAKQHFSATYYWSSTEASSTTACNVFFTNGSHYTYSKSFSNCVRAFRLVTF
jgi:hypothetical protein